MVSRCRSVKPICLWKGCGIALAQQKGSTEEMGSFLPPPLVLKVLNKFDLHHMFGLRKETVVSSQWIPLYQNSPGQCMKKYRKTGEIEIIAEIVYSCCPAVAFLCSGGALLLYSKCPAVLWNIFGKISVWEKKLEPILYYMGWLYMCWAGPSPPRNT